MLLEKQHWRPNSFQELPKLKAPTQCHRGSTLPDRRLNSVDADCKVHLRLFPPRQHDSRRRRGDKTESKGLFFLQKGEKGNTFYTA